MANLVGKRKRIAFSFVDDSQQPVDPDPVKIKILPPNGAPVVYEFGIDSEVVKDSVGHYHFDLTLTARGAWHYHVSGVVASLPTPLIDEGTLLATPPKMSV